ncbi:MAG: HAD family hydrolase [Planktomarina sp.]
MKIAMWSGPRNLSTAMMYAFGNRADCTAVDEPFYASYLARSAVIHPMQDAILQSQPNRAEDVIAAITAPNTLPLQYQKHMTHHMDGVRLNWLADLKNVFLIRHPARVIASYAAKRENPTLRDIGFPRQAAMYAHCRGLGQLPIVIDSDDILADPAAMILALCDALGILFDPAMLSWTAGKRDYDGVWADHWYDAVHQSTGLKMSVKPLPEVDPKFEGILSQAMPFFTQMSDSKITLKRL